MNNQPIMAYSSRPVGLAAPQCVPLGRGRVVRLDWDGLFRSFQFSFYPQTGEIGTSVIFDSPSARVLNGPKRSKHSTECLLSLQSAGREAKIKMASPPVPEFWVRVVGNFDFSGSSKLSPRAMAAILDLVSGPVQVPATAKRWGKIVSIIRDDSGQSQLDYEPPGSWLGDGNGQTLPDPELEWDPNPDSQKLSHLLNLAPWVKPGAILQKGSIIGHHVKDGAWSWEDVYGLPDKDFDWILSRLINSLVDRSPNPAEGLVPMWVVPLDLRKGVAHGGCVQEVFEMGPEDHKPGLRSSTIVESTEGFFDFNAVGQYY